MAQANKFGTFSGVFTPSILTILGVIMYLRLPWIVGQSGFWNTVAIIVVAHIISITTGLSVSSIATDKKVKAGGTYYMISRSLGLPIGGTLGLALFVGLSFSVSLYLIGFSESFLSYWGFEVSKANIRVAGTLALIAVTTVTFISTALALKSQFFILGAIILSLFSVLFGNHDLAPKGDSLIPISTVPWMVLFGIFFPAVTGFEAGVSMSGDLKDPKKSIPVGTIAAIVVGLVVYIGLAGFFSTSVNADSLVNNPNVLLEISLFAPLVIAGIWAATISSALGSILGAPRILQAAANDRIGPRVFAKGYGKENEPRNALLLTFLIAEAGILIGELNVIARVVSMFFITTYGFLNLSSALESWASTDFRPEFRIPKTISIIGSLACFLVMILLDFPAMVGATIVLGALFLYLTRKQLTLESGDTWEGVWSSVVRTGLQKLNRRETHLRNWRPNMLLFSGGEQARPHLVELGEWLVRARGMLTDFVLKENPALDSPLSRIRSREADGEIPVPGVFSKEMSCQNIYQGIDAVSQVYGFADINPNAILMGWGKNSRDPRQFATLIGHLQARDFNVLLLRYDKGRAFGKHARIDLWWRGGNNNATLSLNMLKFLSGSDEWREAQIRLLIVINDSATLNRVHTNMTRLLEEERLEATVKVINNAVEQRPFGEILVAESADADLTLLGLARVQESQLNDFVARTESTLSGLGTVLLSHASSYFKPMYVGIDEDAENVVETATAADWDAAAAALPPITLEGSAGDAES
ncbi:MAG TPA: amino acid permease, partial [Calditrichia bacterium]|nr:amino acid permease [Calditrichia bacterium]